MRNRTLRAGRTVAKLTPIGTQLAEPNAVTAAVTVGLDGGYVRSRHRRPERNFEIVAGKVIGADGEAPRFAFARNGAPLSSLLARWCGVVCAEARQPPYYRTVTSGPGMKGNMTTSRIPG